MITGERCLVNCNHSIAVKCYNLWPHFSARRNLFWVCASLSLSHLSCVFVSGCFFRQMNDILSENSHSLRWEKRENYHECILALTFFVLVFANGLGPFGLIDCKRSRKNKKSSHFIPRGQFEAHFLHIFLFCFHWSSSILISSSVKPIRTISTWTMSSDPFLEGMKLFRF